MSFRKREAMGLNNIMKNTRYGEDRDYDEYLRISIEKDR